MEPRPSQQHLSPTPTCPQQPCQAPTLGTHSPACSCLGRCRGSRGHDSASQRPVSHPQPPGTASGQDGAGAGAWGLDPSLLHRGPKAPLFSGWLGPGCVLWGSHPHHHHSLPPPSPSHGNQVWQPLVAPGRCGANPSPALLPQQWGWEEGGRKSPGGKSSPTQGWQGPQGMCLRVHVRGHACAEERDGITGKTPAPLRALLGPATPPPTCLTGSSREPAPSRRGPQPPHPPQLGCPHPPGVGGGA